MLWFEFSGTTIGALTEIRVAQQKSRCKELRRIQSCTRPSTMVTTPARAWKTLRLYLTLCLLHLLPCSLALTALFLLHPNKSAPFSHLLSLHLSKGSARRRLFLPQLPPMITSSLLTSPLMIHPGMSLYHHQHLTQSTRVWTFQMSSMILHNLIMSLNPSFNLDKTHHVLVFPLLL